MPYANPPTEPSAPIGPLKVRPMTTTCRDTAAAGKNPVPTMTPAPPAGPHLVRGTILRIADLRVSIREHQSGGTPIHAVPTRRAHPPRSPPRTLHPKPPPFLGKIVLRGSSASTSYVLAALRALHVGPLPRPRRSPPRNPEGEWVGGGHTKDTHPPSAEPTLRASVTLTSRSTSVGFSQDLDRKSGAAHLVDC
jgi:hypothetical protein